MSKEDASSSHFINKCIEISITDESCLLGSSVLLISIILLSLNIFALIKMTKFYKKFNFENTIILLSIIQTIILQAVLITSYDIFFEAFFLVQIFIISLIIRKFIILAIEPKTFFDKNGIFLLLNILNFVIFSIYPSYLNIFKGHHSYVKLFYRIFHALAACILSYYCIFFIKLTVKYKKNYLKSYYFLYEANLANNNKKTDSNNNDKPNDNNKKEDDTNNKTNNDDLNNNNLNEKLNDNQNDENNNLDNNNNSINNTENVNIDSINNKNNDANAVNNNEKNKNGKKPRPKHVSTKGKGEVFYHKKKKQIRYLYVVNLFCAVVEICFTVIRNFILNNHYLNHDYKTIPNSLTGDIIYYIYLIVCFLNVSVNYLCFYFYIRVQYNKNAQPYMRAPGKNLLDDDYINEESNKKSNNSDVNAFLFSLAKNKEEDPVAVDVKAEDRDSLNFTEFESGNNNNALLPDDF